MPHWRAIQCNPRQETTARDNLENLGVRCFLPWRWVRNWRNHRAVLVKRAYFPGYLFGDLEDQPPLGNVVGLRQVIGEVEIPETVIGGIKSLCEPDGRINEPLLKRGDTVEIGNLVATIETLDETTATVLIPIFGTMFLSHLPASRVLAG